MHEYIDYYIDQRIASGELYGEGAQSTRQRLERFAAHCNDIPPWDVTREDVREWLASSDLRPATRRSYLSAVRVFYRWLNVENIVTHDPTIGVAAPRAVHKENRSLTPRELEALEWVLPDNRARLIYSLMRYEGLRASEVANLQLHDIDFDRRLLWPRGKGYRGERSRRVPYTDHTAERLRIYLNECPRAASSGPLIRSERNWRVGVSGRAITKMMSAWMEDAGIKRGAYDGVSAHALRHTAAEEVAEHADDIRLVQQFLGHSNLATTQTYLRREVEGLGEIQRRRT